MAPDHSLPTLAPHRCAVAAKLRSHHSQRMTRLQPQPQPASERRARALTPARGEFELVDQAGAVLLRGSELRCQAAVVEYFGRDHWFGEDGAVLRGGDEGEPPVVVATVRPIPKPAVCALCHRPIEPDGSGMPIQEGSGAALYHPGECHSQAVVMFLLERERDRELDEVEQRRAELAERYAPRGR
jgi:hypothetical protein